MANWRLSDEGYKLFNERLKANGWNLLNKTELAKLLKVERNTTLTNLLNRNHEGWLSKLKDVKTRLGLDEDEVESDSFARRYFEEVKTPDDPDWQEAHILATNVYLKTPQGWRIVIHHASVAPGKAADDLGSAAAMLH